MATVKITVTVPEELAAYIRERVEAGAFESISAFVTLAAQSYRDVEPLDLLIASMIAESGEPDRAADGWVDSAIGVARAAADSAGSGQPGTAPDAVVDQEWRGGSGRQARVAALLGLKPEQLTTVALDTAAAKRIGSAVAASGHTDIVDVHVAIIAADRSAGLLTSDRDDLLRVDPDAIQAATAAMLAVIVTTTVAAGAASS